MSTNISNLTLKTLANTLLTQDADKVITEEEIKLFVLSNEEEFTALSIDTDAAIGELKDILKDNMETTSQNTEETTESGNNDGSDPVAEYNKLKEKIDEYTKLLEQYDIQINQLTKDTQSLEAELETAINEYNKKEAELIRENEYLEKTMNDINSTKENLETDVENQQKRAVWNAINDYDPEKDGDWDSYIQKACEGTVYSPLASKLSSLVSESKITVSDIQGMASRLKKAGEAVEILSDKIATNTSELTNLNSIKASTTKALEKAQEDLKNSILNLVSEEEMCLVTSNDIDLKETLSDGSPRYIFAKGKSDGQYHIYDMRSGASLARQYGREGSLRGDDIVPSGNGYITMNAQGEAAPDGDEIFWLTDCGMQSDTACYSTCSPLEFDIQGDGHKLDTSKTVKFDIDGDGILDDINDSTDAILVFDKDGDGISGEDGSEMFGDNTDLDNKNGKDGYKNGFEALGALRDKAIKEGILTDRGDGKLNADDLKALEKNYGLKIKTGGYNSEAKSLSDVGITEINVSNNEVSEKTKFDSFGNEIQTQQGATFKINGKESTYVDMWHRKYDENTSDTTASGLLFDIKKVENYAMNAKSDIDSRTSAILAKSQFNSSSSNELSLKAIKDMNKTLNEDFWSGVDSEENIFTKHNNEIKKEEEAKKPEEEEKEKETH